MSRDRVALVTGANKGLGRETARQLASGGVSVLLGSRDEERGQAAARVLLSEGIRVVPVQLDVTDPTSVEAVAKQLSRDYGRLDILVNNAGTLVSEPALTLTAVHLRQTFEVNLFGVVTVINTMLPLLRESEAGRIVNLSSTIASQTLTSEGSMSGGATDPLLAYTASKTALNMVTIRYAEAFARDQSLSHVKINAATPGRVATDINNHTGTRTVEEGVRVVVRLATLPEHGPSGGFFGDEGPVAW